MVSRVRFFLPKPFTHQRFLFNFLPSWFLFHPPPPRSPVDSISTHNLLALGAKKNNTHTFLPWKSIVRPFRIRITHNTSKITRLLIAPFILVARLVSAPTDDYPVAKRCAAIFHQYMVEMFQRCFFCSSSTFSVHKLSITGSADRSLGERWKVYR